MERWTDPAAQTTTLTYDAVNEPTFVSYSDPKTPNVTYRYDANGRRSSMTDGTGTKSYSWGSLGQLRSVTNGAGQSTEYGYDLIGNLNVIL